MKKKHDLSFWIPFAGVNRLKLGTRVEVYTRQDAYYVSVFPTEQQARDERISNGRLGLKKIKARIADLSDAKRAEDLFLNICSSLLLSHQKLARLLQAKETAAAGKKE